MQSRVSVVDIVGPGLFISGFVLFVYLCASFFVGCATEAAGVRRQAMDRLITCIGASQSGWERRMCAQSAATFCKRQGLETSCGSDGTWAR